MPRPFASTLSVRLHAADRERLMTASLAILRPAERERLALVPAPDVRARSAVGRALAVLLASRFSGAGPERIELASLPDGRPVIHGAPALHVSIAHAGQVVVASLASAPVGVDVELVREPGAQVRRLAQRLFAEGELAELRELPDALLPRWLQSVWTIKEAVGKATGLGVVPALRGVSATGCPDHPRLASVFGAPGPEAWTLRQMRAPGGDETVTVALAAPDGALGRVVALGPWALERLAGVAQRRSNR